TAGPSDPPARPASSGEQVPADSSERKTPVAGTGVDHVIGGHDSMPVVIHGCPQNWCEWHAIAPALAERHTVIPPDLPGAGRSEDADHRHAEGQVTGE
ncbi:alpha/beta fold hydrolase, partial [Streptomyces sp. NPDC059766]|uniref:alpha/beta fold hydrolase n=1 Tax=Streptomyces sp. NPDC059766 TaxID=3346940 RepID=UPI003655A3F8